MPTRTGGSSANQSLKTDLYSSQNPLESRADSIAALAKAVARRGERKSATSAEDLNFKKNLDYMMERYGLDKVGPDNKEIKDFVDGLDVTSRGNISRNPSLYARAAQTMIENDMQEVSKFADARSGEPEIDKTTGKVFRDEGVYELAQRLAMKVVTETFNTVGGQQEPDSPFAIAKQTPNGVRVDPMQMKQDITGLFMDYAAARETVRRFGYRDAKEQQNSPKGFVDSVTARFANEIRNYGQYGKGEFCDIFDKAIEGFKKGLGKSYREERGA